MKNIGSEVMILTRRGMFWTFLQCDSLWHYSVSHSAVDKITAKEIVKELSILGIFLIGVMLSMFAR